MEELFEVTRYFPEGVCVFDKEYRVVFWNKILEEWTGLELSEIKGRQLTDLYPHLREIIFCERVDDVLAGGPPVIFSSQLHESIIPAFLPGGEPRIQTSTVIGHETGEGIFGVMVIEDVTELKKEVLAYRRMKDRAILALNERIKAEEAVVSANEEANLYLDIMSHDIANINMLVMGYSILMEDTDGETVKDYAKKITIAAQRSSEIIKSVSTIRKVRHTASSFARLSLDDQINKAVLQYPQADIEYEMSGLYVYAMNS